jgi:hypothetical protein
MDITLKQAHGADYTFLLGFVFVAAFVLAGCGMFERDVKTDVPFVAQDGTTVEAGGTVYYRTDGRSTALAADPATGKPHKTVREYDTKKIEKATETVEDATKNIPWGLGGLATLLVTTIGGIGLKEALRKNAEKRAALGIPSPKSEKV